MPVYGAQAKAILVEHLDSGKPLDDIQLNNINLEDFSLSNRKINTLSCRRSILDNSRFLECDFYDSLFEESNLKDAIFRIGDLQDVNFTSSILLRSQFIKAAFNGGAFKRSYMQRTTFSHCSLKNTLFLNVEAAKSKIGQSVFVQCDFRFDDSGGITGFQNSLIADSLFIGCTFQGFALTAVELDNCVFINSTFALPDWEDIPVDKAAFCHCSGIPAWKRLPAPGREPLHHENQAAQILTELKGSL